MSDRAFDDLARAVAAPVSRRRALALAVGAALSSALGGFRAPPATGACNGPTNTLCGAGTTPCGPCCCKPGIACVNSASGTCGCPAGTTPCGTACCQAGIACANPGTNTCRGGPAVACLNGQPPCGSQCCPSGQTCVGGQCSASVCSPGAGACDANFLTDCSTTAQCECTARVDGGIACVAKRCPSGNLACATTSDCAAGQVCVINNVGCCNSTAAAICMTVCPTGI